MAKIRTVKPELFRHEELFDAEKNSGLPLRLVFIGLFTTADAAGRFRWRPKQLKLDIMPYDEVDFDEILNALITSGFIVKYEHANQSYGYIPTWYKHQSINKREPDSRLPDPNMCTHVQARVAPIPISDSTITNTELENFADQNSDITKQENIYIYSEICEKCASKNSDKIPDNNHLTEPCTCTHMQNPATQMRASLEMEVEMDMELEREMELEVEGCGKEKEVRTAKHVLPNVEKIFEHWKFVMEHPRAVLDKHRRKYIRDALGMGYDVASLCKAIDGCNQTPHNIGHNDRGERYDGLHIIFRSADQIDRFIKNAEHPPRPVNKAEKRIHSNLNAAQSWLANSQKKENNHD